MKLLVLQEDLSKALNLASRFTNAKIQLPIGDACLPHKQ